MAKKQSTTLKNGDRRRLKGTNIEITVTNVDDENTTFTFMLNGRLMTAVIPNDQLDVLTEPIPEPEL